MWVSACMHHFVSMTRNLICLTFSLPTRTFHESLSNYDAFSKVCLFKRSHSGVTFFVCQNKIIKVNASRVTPVHVPNTFCYFIYLFIYLFQTVISIIMLIPDSSTFTTLIGFTSFASWLSYGGTFAALLWLRWKRPNMTRPFKVIPLVPYVASSE